ncbi:MAG TPA: hypothetical protein VNO32_64925 [Candidatus Acidoferrum sp.]|nr:hypothetical protein [Candidatus Acidoferrum sp.]
MTRDASDDSVRFQPMERLKVYLFGATVLFASFGMGEAVYRLLFSEFDGTDYWNRFSYSDHLTANRFRDL